MQRMRFGVTKGPNGKVYTVNGFITVFGHIEGDWCIEITGPKIGVRAIAVLSKDEMRNFWHKMGAELGLVKYELIKDPWGENPDYPRKEWNQEAGNNETSLGYWEWVNSKIEEGSE